MGKQRVVILCFVVAWLVSHVSGRRHTCVALATVIPRTGMSQ
jgi:hypothetical protein